MINKDKFDQLIQFQNDTAPCITIQIPTSRAGNSQKDKIRLKNALSDTISELTNVNCIHAIDFDERNATKYLREAYELLNDDKFWMQLSDALIIFCHENHFSYYKLPIDIDTLIYVNDHFYLRHLLPLINPNDRFFVLALSQNEVRFFEGQQYSISPVIIEDLVPNGMEELAGLEDEKAIYSHSSGGNTPIFHGHGGWKDAQDKEIESYFKIVDDGLMKMLHDEKAPLIIYSTVDQIAKYKSISKYSNIMDNAIQGNPENDDPVLIHEKAWKEVKPHFNKEIVEAKEAFDEAIFNDKAGFSVPHIIPAAINGKIDTLFIDNETYCFWGTHETGELHSTMHKKKTSESECLLNRAAIETYKNGGKVYAVEHDLLPRVAAPLNAIYRF